MSYLQQVNHCLKNKLATKRWDGVYICKTGKVCSVGACEDIHKNGIDRKDVSGKVESANRNNPAGR